MQIREKESIRQKNNLRYLQQEELVNIEKLQNKQFNDFTKAWDEYTGDYESTAYMSIE